MLGSPKLLFASRMVMPLLIVQMLTGMYVNLFIQPPPAQAGVSPLVQIFTGGSPLLALHILVGTVILLLSLFIVLLALMVRAKLYLVLSAAGLAAVLSSFISGVLFVQGGYEDNTLSFVMATGFVIGIAIYGALAQAVNGSFRSGKDFMGKTF